MSPPGKRTMTAKQLKAAIKKQRKQTTSSLYEAATKMPSGVARGGGGGGACAGQSGAIDSIVRFPEETSFSIEESHHGVPRESDFSSILFKAPAASRRRAKESMGSQESDSVPSSEFSSSGVPDLSLKHILRITAWPRLPKVMHHPCYYQHPAVHPMPSSVIKEAMSATLDTKDQKANSAGAADASAAAVRHRSDGWGTHAAGKGEFSSFFLPLFLLNERQGVEKLVKLAPSSAVFLSNATLTTFYGMVAVNRKDILRLTLNCKKVSKGSLGGLGTSLTCTSAGLIEARKSDWMSAFRGAFTLSIKRMHESTHDPSTDAIYVIHRYSTIRISSLVISGKITPFVIISSMPGKLLKFAHDLNLIRYKSGSRTYEYCKDKEEFSKEDLNIADELRNLQVKKIVLVFCLLACIRQRANAQRTLPHTVTLAPLRYFPFFPHLATTLRRRHLQEGEDTVAGIHVSADLARPEKDDREFATKLMFLVGYEDVMEFYDAYINNAPQVAYNSVTGGMDVPLILTWMQGEVLEEFVKKKCKICARDGSTIEFRGPLSQDSISKTILSVFKGMQEAAEGEAEVDYDAHFLAEFNIHPNEVAVNSDFGDCNSEWFNGHEEGLRSFIESRKASEGSEGSEGSAVKRVQSEVGTVINGVEWSAKRSDTFTLRRASG